MYMFYFMLNVEIIMLNIVIKGVSHGWGQCEPARIARRWVTISKEGYVLILTSRRDIVRRRVKLSEEGH